MSVTGLEPPGDILFRHPMEGGGREDRVHRLVPPAARLVCAAALAHLLKAPATGIHKTQILRAILRGRTVFAAN